MNKVSQNDDNLKEQTNISRKNNIFVTIMTEIIYIRRKTKVREVRKPVN